ncbi:hypothetical protein HFO07_26550 [Rhizobium leguminosarum]|uniref:DEAD/DEAH box helicase n=1 Tax=Rhizobium leguminosarum TaxID=384 RepID=UPI001C984768|nr:helicase-related protein [Rhizobium leguminosarum]MBY5760174.1 hypothetical protein [Rhizobium leguminosarum]
MESKLVAHLARCDSTALTALLGEATMALLTRVGSDAIVPSGLAELVVHVLGEDGALRDPVVRGLLFAELKPEEGRHLCEVLAVATYAPATTLAGVDFDNDQTNADLLRRYFNVAAEVGAPLVEPTQNATADHQLRTHQVNAYRKLRRLIADPTATALVHMPFGAGKLRTVATAVLDLYRGEADGRLIVWLAAGNVLCDEVFDELHAVWQQLGSRNVTAFRIYGHHPTPDLDKIGNGIVVADIAKLFGSETGLISLGRRTRALVLGDAELLSHPQAAGVVDAMSREGEFSVVGISASPASVISARPTLQVLAGKFSGACVSIEADDPAALLCAAGDVDPITVEIVTIASARLDPLTTTGIDVSTEDMNDISRDVERNHALLEIVLAEAKAALAPIVLYATTAEHARLFAGLLRLRGMRAAAITGEMSLQQRTLALEKFTARSDKILCLHDCFVSGADVSGVSTAVLARPTTSSALIYEMVGRLASGRGQPENPLRIVVAGDPVPDYLVLAQGLGNWDALNI